MGCFEQLVKSKFLANALAELQQARQLVAQQQEEDLYPPLRHYSADKKVRKQAYLSCMDYYDLRRVMLEGLASASNMLYYVQLDYLVFAFSTDKSLIDDAIRYSYNLNGDLPIYRSRHRINGITVHTVLIDTRFSFQPMSPN